MKKLIFGGLLSVAAVVYLSTQSYYVEEQSLFSVAMKDPILQKELETEFVNFIAIYGKSYESKAEIPSRF